MMPSIISRYEIKEEIGRGGMAIVYLAHDPRFKRDVAIKVLPREFLHDPKFRARFEREAEVIASLEHPAIVPVHDFGEAEGQPFLVMRFMSGGSLADRLDHGSLPLNEIAEIISRLSPALDKAHERGIIHRDLKPGNILFDEEGNAFLGDFGIVKLTEATTTLTGGGVVGTPAYMSPEQAHGTRKIDGRSDVYSLGVILYEMLSGERPYHADTPVQLAVMHVIEPIPSVLEVNPHLPLQCDKIINLAMAKSPEERYQKADELAAAVSTLSRLPESEAVPKETLHEKVVERLLPEPQLRKEPAAAEVLPPTTDVKVVAEAIPLWQLPWVFPAIGVVVLILLGVFFGPRLWAGVSSASQRTPVPTGAAVAAVAESASTTPKTPTSNPELTSRLEAEGTIAQEEITSTPTSSATPTPQPSATKTSVPSTTLTEAPPAFYEPILAYIDKQWPWFQDTFYTYKDYAWGYLGKYGPQNPEAEIIADGALHLVGTGGRLLFSTATPLLATDFAVEYELEIAVPISSVSSESYTGFRFRLTGTVLYPDFDFRYSSYYDFRYYPRSRFWRVYKNLYGSTLTKIDEGEIGKEKLTLRIIAYGGSFAIFIDGELISTFQDTDIMGKENYFLIFGNTDIKVDIDNLKFWTLEGRNF